MSLRVSGRNGAVFTSEQYAFSDWPKMPYQCKCLDLKVLVKRCLPSLPTRLLQR